MRTEKHVSSQVLAAGQPRLPCFSHRGTKEGNQKKKGSTRISLESCVCPIPSIISSYYSVVIVGANKSLFMATGDKPLKPTLCRAALPPPPSGQWLPVPDSVLKMTCFPTKHQAALFSIVIISYCLPAACKKGAQCWCALLPSSTSCVGPAKVRREHRPFLFLLWPWMTKQCLTVTAAVKTFHQYSSLSTFLALGVF